MVWVASASRARGAEVGHGRSPIRGSRSETFQTWLVLTVGRLLGMCQPPRAERRDRPTLRDVSPDRTAPEPQEEPLTTSIRDVAEHAGVSVGHGQQRPQPARASVSEATRDRVLDAIAALGFVRNESARQLRAGRSRTIGLVVLDIANPFFTDVARGVEEVGQRRGPRRDPLQLRRPAGQGGGAPRRARRAARAGRAHHADRRALPRTWTRCATAGCRSCCVDRRRAGPDQCSVAVDDVLGGRLAAEHLLERGHRRIAFVGGSSGLPQVQERHEGVRAGGPGGAADPTTR